MQGKVEICGVNTSKLKVLKNEETVALLKRTKEGDTAAREELIAGNLRLVLSVIQKFSNRGENVDDLFQVCLLYTSEVFWEVEGVHQADGAAVVVDRAGELSLIHI